jgi:alkanesulfonate monooxygenase SsuD/methylene tetrahydromethanopterin reductase-like flavin-dependent oxidoreductase (luciferase family)
MTESASTLKFGLLFNTDYHAEAHGPPSEYYGRILDQVVLAETLGFHSAWFGEHHYASYSFGAPAVMAMAAAGRTQRIRLGTGVSLLPIHNPIRLAEEYATLDVLSGGRLEYGIGRGFLRYALDLFGIDEDESHDRYREATEIIMRAWTQKGPISHDGRFWQFEDYEFFPAPAQTPHPPIYASATLTPESFVWTAQQGFHLATACFVPNKEGVRDGVALYRRTLEESGRDFSGLDVAGVFQMFCGESHAEAHKVAGGHVIEYLDFFGSIDARSPHRSKAYEHHGGGTKGMFDGVTSEMLDAQKLLLISDSAGLVERIEWAREYYGLNYLLLEVGQGGIAPKLVEESLVRFSREVMPRFSETRGSAGEGIEVRNG